MEESMTHDVPGHIHKADPPKNRAFWTDEHIAILMDEHGKGTPRRIIADIINERTGSNFTKSAVCGKIDRIFPAARPVKTEEEKAAVKARRQERDRLRKRKRAARNLAEFGTERRIKNKYETIRIVSANGNSNAMRVIRTISMELGNLRCVEVEPLNLDLLDLEKGQCREPYGDGPFTFCGHPTLKGSSYCGPHHFENWVKPESRPALARKRHGTDFARSA